ncbi:atrial natriuretic peptide receptor 1-like isoform X6 [Bolinopsis microptera]|uniref:atrial natriuretic peptide receptor 1-like isoform X6 n=1 Tax=Bolinopsis microptera TaxID=2820187 RepID=UPI003079572F
MLSLLLIIYLPIICWSLIRLEQDDTETPYQVLIYFGGPELMFAELDNNLYGPGIVEALEKIDAEYDFESILGGTNLTYKVANCKEFSVSDAMDYLESQLLTRRYEIKEHNKTFVRSELSLILGPIHLIVFLKPYCYANRYNCIFGVGRISTASANAISDDFVYPYEHNNQVTNNILLDNTRDGPEPIFKQFFDKFRWNFQQISIFDLRGSDSYEQSQSLILDLQKYAIDHSKNRVSIGSDKHNTETTLNYTDANDYLINKVPYACRVVLLFGSQQMVRDMMLQAYDAGMTQSNEYAFIIIPTNYFPLYSWKADPAYSNLYWDEGQASRDEDAKKAFQSAFIVTADIDTKNFDNFTAAVKEQAKKEPFNYDFKDRAVPLYAANYHDAVLLWAYAMNNHYNESAKTLDVGKLYNRTFTKDDFNDIEPITGPIELDEAGDRVNTFLFWHLNKAGQWQKIGKYAHEKYEVLVDEEDIAWPNNGKSAPLAEPECGFNGEKCDNRMVIGISAGAGALAVLVLGLAVMTYMYRKAKFEAALASMSWRIPPIEIRDVGRDPLGSSVFGSRRSSMVGSRSSTVSSNPSANLKKKSYQFFSKRAQYQNKIVALKTVLPQYMTINRALMIEMKNLKEMRNENLLTVYGCTIDNDICFLVTEYCSKGSLQDLLENDDVKLDDMLKFSLINDLAKGMRFLQASVIESHGYLKSSNCIINNHFSLKISDFSRSIFMSDMERLNRATEEARNERLVYRAPELLRMQCIPCKGTKEGDMYSFGIVVHEILVREGPFGLSDMRCDLTATEVINLVTKTASQIPYRPEFPFSSDSKVTRIISMARDAWTEEPLERPNFQTIRSILRSIRVDASGGIVENLLGRMEKYATNLEELVEERTAQLQVEKKKTDDLLESMLPKYVFFKMGRMPREIKTVYFIHKDTFI